MRPPAAPPTPPITPRAAMTALAAFVPSAADRRGPTVAAPARIRVATIPTTPRTPAHATRRAPAVTALLRAFVLILALAPPLAAQPLPGAEVPGLQTAVRNWLADDEASALPALAALAHQGNSAARLLLALIDSTPALQGPMLSQRNRAERVALMRAPGGMSGQTWLARIEDTPQADLWRILRQVEAGPPVIAGFAALGEARAARVALVTLAAREHQGLHALDPETVDPEMIYLLWRGADPTRRAILVARVPPGHPQRALMGEPADSESLARWLAESPAAAPLSRLCDALCPGSAAPPCRLAAMGALASHDALLTLGSPLESLVPQETFLASPRGRASVLRRILLAVPMSGRRAMVAAVAAQSQCLGDALAAESRRHRPLGTPAGEDG